MSKDNRSRRSILGGLGGMIALGTLTGLSTPVVATDEANLNSDEEKKAQELLQELRKSSDRAKGFENLDQDEKRLVIEALKTTEIKIDSPDTPLSTLDDVSTLDSGKRVTSTYTGTNPISGDLWTFTVEVQWSYDGNEITSIDRTTAFGETYEIGWTYKGIQNEDLIGSVGDSQITYTAEGLFELCFQFCGQSTHPVIEVDAYGDGEWDAEQRKV
ncbi:hypothetical protein ACT4ML_15435 [Natrinema sp. LN54]|uniref:hypothetical protein n=1 Tax=Natrinema sp. LN54 TaxID=3458705 RepID=UPI0040368A1F